MNIDGSDDDPDLFDLDSADFGSDSFSRRDSSSGSLYEALKVGF